MVRLGLVFGLLALGGCGRGTDFLYYLQGTPPTEFQGVHKLKELKGETKVDIVWVIDNSGSMGSYQQELIRNADIFITDFVTNAGLEWKMGILSTDFTEEPFIGFTPSTLLTHRTPNGPDLFKRAVQRLGTNGDYIERTFAPLQKHLAGYPDFTRKDATLTLIMVTDAPEQSQLPAANMLTYLRQLKGDLSRVVSYGVYASVDFGCRFTDERWNYSGSPYEEVIDATQGKVFKLCDTDFGVNLADMGQDLVERIRRPFIQLKDRPVVTSLRVVYEGRDLPGGPQSDGGLWMYDFDLNRVVFHSLEFAPGDDEKVTVVYHLADEIVR